MNDCRCQCICDEPGFCRRYQREMSEHDYKICRNEVLTEEEQNQYRKTWIAEAQAQRSKEAPGLFRKGVNFGKAVAEHVTTGAGKLDDDQYQTRLAICRDCPSCFVKRMICQEKSCGCRLRVKARWPSQVCPLNKWPDVKIGVPDSS